MSGSPAPIDAPPAAPVARAELVAVSGRGGQPEAGRARVAAGWALGLLGLAAIGISGGRAASPLPAPATVSGAAFEAGVLPGPAPPLPDGPRRILLVIGRGFGPIPGATLGVALPGWAGARRLAVRGATTPDVARDAWLRGVDTARDRPIGGPRPRRPRVESLLDVAAEAGVHLYLYATPELVGARGATARLHERIEPDDEDRREPAAGVFTRLGYRLETTPAPARDREVWLVELHAGEGDKGWPANTADLVRRFLSRGDPGRAAALVVNLPEAPGGALYGGADGAYFGYQIPGAPAARLELEDLAPSVCGVLGLRAPAGATGVPRVDVLAPRDPPGVYANLAATAAAAAARQAALHRALGRPPPEALDLGAGADHAATGRFAEALEAVRAPRLSLRDSRRRQALATRRATPGAVETGGLLVVAALAALWGLAWGFGRGLAWAVFGGTACGAAVLLWFASLAKARPDPMWLGLCQQPWRAPAMGLAAAAFFLAPAALLGVRGRTRSGAVVAAGLVIGAGLLVGVAEFLGTYGDPAPWALWPTWVPAARCVLGATVTALPLVALPLEALLSLLSWARSEEA